MKDQSLKVSYDPEKDYKIYYFFLTVEKLSNFARIVFCIGTSYNQKYLKLSESINTN